MFINTVHFLKFTNFKLIFLYLFICNKIMWFNFVCWSSVFSSLKLNLYNGKNTLTIEMRKFPGLKKLVPRLILLFHFPRN